MVAALLLIATLATMHQWVLWSASGRIYGEADVPKSAAILVLGAKIRGKTPSHMLEDRLRTAANLYQRGKAPCILISGDGRAADYDEVEVMRTWLREHGVPAAAIREDRAGLRTLDSLVRARTEFGYDRLIVVTNPFHVPRSVFLGLHHGIDAVGVPAPHGKLYNHRTLLANRGREILARIWAFWDVFVFGTAPEVRGPAPEPKRR